MKKLILLVMLLACFAYADVSSLTTRVTYTGNSSTTTFAFSFPIIESSDLVVLHRVIATGVESVLTETTHYSVAASNSDFSTGGSITTVATYANTITLTLLRDIPDTQTTTLSDTGVLRLSSLENGYDKLTMLVQQLQEELNRSLIFPRSDSTALSGKIPNSVDRVGKNLGFDSSGNVTVTDASGTFISINAFWDDVIVKSPWVDVRAYGATGDGVTDDGAAIQAAMDSISQGTVFFPVPDVSYLFGSTLNKPQGISMVGIGQKKSQMNYTGTGKAISCSYAAAVLDESFISNIELICDAVATDAIYVKGAQYLIIENVFIDNLSNSGVDGIHVDGTSHFMQIRDCRIFAGTNGIRIEDQSGNSHTDNNSMIVRANYILGTVTCLKIVDNGQSTNNLRIETNHFNPTTQTTKAIIELAGAEETIITNNYFEPHGSSTAPLIKIIGDCDGTVIAHNRIQSNGLHSPGAIQCGGTSAGTIISNNIFVGNSDTIVAFQSGLNNVFSDNRMSGSNWPADFTNTFEDSWGRPKTITVSPGVDYTLRHKGWVDREWNISQEFSRFYDDFHLYDSSTLDIRWDIDDGDTVAVQSNEIHGVVDLTTSGTINHTCIVRSPARVISSDKSILTFYLKPVSVTDVNFQVGIWFDATNYMYFEVDTAVDGNLHIVSSLAGSETDTDTGVIATTFKRVYSIEMLTNSVEFFWGGISVGTITTDILTGAAQIHIFHKALTGAAKTLNIDTVTVLQVR